MSALNSALIQIAKAGNLVGKVTEDGDIDASDAWTVLKDPSALSGLATIDFAGVVSEAGTLTDAAKASAVAAFKGAFDLAADATEAAVELAVDAAFDILSGFVKGKRAFAALVPKAA